jgi:uncharacterized protein (DUF2267 family)
MRYDEFVAKVRTRGEYTDREEAEQVIETVLGLLASRLNPGEAKDLAAQLPAEAAAALAPPGRLAQDRGEAFGVQEFLRRVAIEMDATAQTAQWDASAVLSTVAETVSGGEINDLITQLPSGYALLFGKPSLSG